MTIKIKGFYLSIGAGFLYPASLAFGVAFAVTHQEWNIVGVLISAIAGSLMQSRATQDAPATALAVKTGGDSIPVINGKEEPIAKVATLPTDATDHLAEVNASADH